MPPKTKTTAQKQPGRSAKLKVFRAPIGFHDVYVAAPSRKAALKAWGSEHDLFSRGVAEVVTDPKLTKEPLERPGEIVKRSRGSAEEQIAALPPDKPKRQVEAKADTEPATSGRAAAKAKPKPRPSRTRLDAAEKAMAAAEARHAEEDAALEEKEADLRRERERLRTRQRAERDRLAAAEDRAREAYEAALERWRD